MIDFTLGICCLSRDFPADDPPIPADRVASDACSVVFQLCLDQALSIVTCNAVPALTLLSGPTPPEKNPFEPLRSREPSLLCQLQVLIGSLSERSSIECCKTKTKPADTQLIAALYRAFIADWCTFWKQELLSEILLRSEISDRYINPFIKCFFS